MKQGTLFAVARVSDPTTSHEAAASVRDIRRSQQQVLNLLRLGPATDVDLAGLAMAHGLRISPSGLRTRRSELVAQGLVKETGEYEVLPSGRRAIVWAVAE